MALAGALLGAALAVLGARRFEAPSALSPDRWRIVSPTLDETVRDPLLGRGAQVIEGELVIRHRAFGAADVLVPRMSGAPARVALALGERGGPVTLVLATSDQASRRLLRLGRSTWRMDPGGMGAEGATGGGPWVVESGPDGTSLVLDTGPVRLSAAPLAGVELTIGDAEARVDAIRIEDADGRVVFSDDFEGGGGGGGVPLAGAALGAAAGLAFGVAAARRAAAFAVVLAALPLGLVLLPETSWLAWVEQLYLARTPYWDLARGAVLASALPLLMLGLLQSGLLAPRDAGRGRAGGRSAGAAWLVVGVGVAAAASRGLSGPGWVLGMGGAALLVAPLGLARRAGWDPVRLLLVDLLGLGLLAGLGWQAGLGALLVWRLLWLVASAGSLVQRAPGLGANALLAAAIALPFAAELALRSTYLGEGWSSARLSGEKASESDWREAMPYWRGVCGPAEAGTVVSIAWAGGSSTGGAYQFHNEPTAFFPAQAHAALCASLDPGTALRSTNFGDGGRDTHTIARTIDRILASSQPDVLVLYVGVNDILTQDFPLTRAQREARLARWTDATSLVGLAARSRLITGLGLLTRSHGGGDAAAVSEVPLPEAEANLRTIAEAAGAQGVQVLLLTEQVRADFSGALTGYSQLLHAVAADHAHVTWFDLEAELRSMDPGRLMVDRNHLSREGGARVGRILAPEVARLAGLSPPAPPAEGAESRARGGVRGSGP